VQFVFHALDSTDSTQTEVQRLASQGAPEGTVVTARHQRAGRGRRGHEWWDDPGESLLVSVLLRPSSPPAMVPQLSLVAGLAVADALAAAGVVARIRWPNDLLVNDRKVCGILAEASSGRSGNGTAGAGSLHHVILGIGINLNQTRFPEWLADRATSLRLITGRVHDRDAMLPALLAQIERRYATWQTDGFVALRAAWLAHALLPGQIVRLPDGTLGAGEDVRDDGALLARAADGRRVTVVSGGAVEEATAHAAGH
jgi:BirA family transcriptional regulator, biotin operon repressor / biotin---[acetyl-CoA-carboxylase] ligase